MAKGYNCKNNSCSSAIRLHYTKKAFFKCVKKNSISEKIKNNQDLEDKISHEQSTTTRLYTIYQAKPRNHRPFNNYLRDIRQEIYQQQMQQKLKEKGEKIARKKLQERQKLQYKERGFIMRRWRRFIKKGYRTYKQISLNRVLQKLKYLFRFDRRYLYLYPTDFIIQHAEKLQVPLIIPSKSIAKRQNKDIFDFQSQYQPTYTEISTERQIYIRQQHQKRKKKNQSQQQMKKQQKLKLIVIKEARMKKIDQIRRSQKDIKIELDKNIKQINKQKQELQIKLKSLICQANAQIRILQNQIDSQVYYKTNTSSHEFPSNLVHQNQRQNTIIYQKKKLHPLKKVIKFYSSTANRSPLLKHGSFITFIPNKKLFLLKKIQGKSNLNVKTQVQTIFMTANKESSNLFKLKRHDQFQKAFKHQNQVLCSQKKKKYEQYCQVCLQNINSYTDHINSKSHLDKTHIKDKILDFAFLRLLLK